MNLNIDLFKENGKDTVVFLAKKQGVYKFIKKIKVIGGKQFVYQNKHYMPPKTANYLDKKGNFVHFVDVDTGLGINFMGSANVGFNAQEIDSYVADNMVKNFVKSFGSAIQQDKTLMFTLLGSGVGIGMVIMQIIQVVGYGG